MKQVGRELGVRYVLEGSVRKAGQRLRITGQLIDATTGRASLGRPLRRRSTTSSTCRIRSPPSVVGAIAPQLDAPRSSAPGASRPESLDAYDYYLARPREPSTQWTPEATAEAIALFDKAIELDPGFAASLRPRGAVLLAAQGQRLGDGP